jgi:hypothetical protein
MAHLNKFAIFIKLPTLRRGNILLRQYPDFEITNQGILQVGDLKLLYFVTHYTYGTVFRRPQWPIN